MNTKEFQINFESLLQAMRVRNKLDSAEKQDLLDLIEKADFDFTAGDYYNFIIELEDNSWDYRYVLKDWGILYETEDEKVYDEAKENLIDYFTRIEPNRITLYDITDEEASVREYIKVIIRDRCKKLAKENIPMLIDDVIETLKKKYIEM